MRLPTWMFQPNLPHPWLEEHSIELRDAWSNVISMNTGRALTKSRDRLLALGGIAEEFHRFWGSSQYIAGLWQHNLLEDLLWSTDINSRQPRPAKYRAPSWSWAAVDGGVTLAVSMEQWAKYCHYECEVSHCEAALVNEDSPYGEVTGGHLEIHAVVNRVSWNPMEHVLYVTKPPDGAHEVAEQVRIGNAYPDSVEDVSKTMDQVWAIPVRSSTTVYQMIEGLIVVPTSGEEVFRRVGSFVIPTGKLMNEFDIPAWLSTSRRIIKIV